MFAWFGATGSFLIPDCRTPMRQTDHHEAFALVWHSFMAILVSVGGTFVMKKHRTPIGLGLFVGAIFVMIQWTLVTLVLLGGQIHKKGLTEDEHCKIENLPGSTSDVLTLLLGIVLLLLYGGFEYLLVRAKDELLSDSPLGGSSEYPSAAFSSLDQQAEEQLTAV